MQNYINNDLRETNYNISELHTEIKHESSLLESFDYEYGNYDKEAKTGEILFSVIPKESNENTKITVSLGGNSTTLEKQANGKYTGTLALNISNYYYDVPIVTISDGTTEKSELIETMEFGNLFYEYLPSIYASYEYDRHYSNNKLNLEGTLYVCPSNENKCSFINCRLEIQVNGKLTDEQELELPENEVEKKIELNKTIKAKKSDLVEIYLVAEDESGYIHKAPILIMEEGEDTALTGSEEIYDENGKQMRYSFDSIYIAVFFCLHLLSPHKKAHSCFKPWAVILFAVKYNFKHGLTG